MKPAAPVTLCLCTALLVAFTVRAAMAETDPPPFTPGAVIRLPAPRLAGKVPVEEALHLRRSVRAFAPQPLALGDAAQLLWAAQGITEPKEGKRTAPSAGATYPLEMFLVAGEVEGLGAGVYRYRPRTHDLVATAGGDRRGVLAAAARQQTWLADAPAVFLVAAVPGRTASRYGSRAERYVLMEAGHAGENLQLQAVALGLVSVVVGAFDDAEVQRVLGLAGEEQPLSLMPVGAKGP